MRSNNKVMIFLCVIMLMGVVYALLTTNLGINGTTNITSNNWSVHFDSESLLGKHLALVEGKEPTIVEDSNNLNISFVAELNEPGDVYEFSVDVVNDGTLDAMIDEFTLTPEEEDIPEYMNYTVSWDNGHTPKRNDALFVGDRLTLNILVEYRTDIEVNQLPSEDTGPISMSISLTYVQANENATQYVDNRLYYVLKNEAEIGIYAREYTGEHKDSMDTSKSTMKIYHYYASNDAAAEVILDKNNVIFAGQCWQMIRTTDTGGVKMIYNGEVEDGKCLSTRGTHIGYSSRTSQNLASNYFYGNMIVVQTCSRFQVIPNRQLGMRQQDLT